MIARCTCGNVEVEAVGAPILSVACYCDDCQKGSRQIEALPGLCRKTRKAIPAAIRRGLSNHPEIAFELLNAHDLLRDT